MESTLIAIAAELDKLAQVSLDRPLTLEEIRSMEILVKVRQSIESKLPTVEVPVKADKAAVLSLLKAK